MRVNLGGNLFIDCPALIAYRGIPVVRVELHPLRIHLELPPDLPPVPLRAETTDISYTVSTQSDNQPVALATLTDAATETVNMFLDLRPLGMNIVADLQGIRIGRNVFRGNLIQGAPFGINLG